MLNSLKFTEKGAGFSYAHNQGIADIGLLHIATTYKNQVSRKYKTITPKSLPSILGDAEKVWASLKYDGEGVFLYYDKTHCFAFNAPSGRTRIGLPCLKDAQEKLEKAGVEKGIFACEIYLKSKGKRSRNSDVNHITASGTPEERTSLSLAIFDVLMLNGKDFRNNEFETNLKTIETTFGKNPKENTHVAEYKILKASELPNFFTEITETRKEEGIVFKNLGNNAQGTFKAKPQLTLDATIIGYIEGEFEGKYGVLSLLTGFTAPDGKTIQVTNRIGSGFDDNLRETLLPKLQALRTNDPLTMTDSEGRVISFVRPEIVIEMEGEDIQETEISGKEVTSQTLEWNETEKSWSFKGIAQSIHLTHATFSTFRPDKVWNDGGTRMEQAFSEKTIESILKKKEPLNETPKIIYREVFRKFTKGQLAVRKLVVVERNSPDFWKYTLHWTDFSAGRAEALKSEVVVANENSRLQEFIEKYQNEANKKGWEKVEPTN